jgi:hypothetical protein
MEGYLPAGVALEQTAARPNPVEVGGQAVVKKGFTTKITKDTKSE